MLSGKKNYFKSFMGFTIIANSLYKYNRYISFTTITNDNILYSALIVWEGCFKHS